MLPSDPHPITTALCCTNLPALPIDPRHPFPSRRGPLRSWESNFAGNVMYGSGGGSSDGGLKFLVGSFASLFGTNAGEQLRSWAASHGWFVVWALGNTMSGFHPEGAEVPPNAMNKRILDPKVLAATSCTNMSKVADAVAPMDKAWAAVAALRRNASLTHHKLSPDDWYAQYNTLLHEMPKEAAVQPLSARACADQDRCIGTTIVSGDCVCY